MERRPGTGRGLHRSGGSRGRAPRRGWAPFWRYRSQGLYGQQLQHLYELFPADQVLVLRYRELVDDPAAALASVYGFLGVAHMDVGEVPRDNIKPFVPDTWRTRALSRLLRAGATAGAWTSPSVWRQLERPLVDVLHRSGTRRPPLPERDRATVRSGFVDDLRLLEEVTGRCFGDWREGPGGGDYASRAEVAAASGST